MWAVSDGSDTQNNDVLALHVNTGQFFFHTLSRNAFANRIVSGEIRLIGGGYSGFFYNEYDASTTGNLDNSASAIDADIITARLNHGLPGVVKKVPYIAIQFDPIGSEVCTVQFRVDDSSEWTSFDESTFTMSGTDIKIGKFTGHPPYENIQLRVRDANSGERYRATRIGVPRPTTTWTVKS